MIATIIERTVEDDLIVRAIKEIGSAQDEVILINRLILLSIEASGADGASYVPVDENMQPIAVFRGGNFPAQVTDNLLEYIASPSVRQQCKYCSKHEMVVHDCPLILQVNSQTDPYTDTQVIQRS